MTNKAEGAPAERGPPTICEVCGREWAWAGTDRDADGKCCRPRDYASTAVPTLVCYRLGYERLRKENVELRYELELQAEGTPWPT